MRKIALLVVLCMCFTPFLFSQNNVVFSGRVIDKQTKSPMIGAAVYSKAHPEIGTVSKEKGTFSLSLPIGKHTIVCSFMGYKNLEVAVELTQSKEMLLRIEEDGQMLDEVMVYSRRVDDRISNVQIGVERIEISELAKTPSLFGERDIIRSIQLLPGIKAEGEGSGGFEVRGGTAAQNLILLDDATVYNAGHLMGIFSTFNDNALTNASLYKGQVPAQFGGATSSVFDINTKSGDIERYKFSGSIGLLSAKVNVEGPIVKDKLSFFVAARRTYLDMFLKMTDDYKDNTMNFYDINAKVNYHINRRNRLSLTFFVGKDNMGLEDLVSMKWGNQTATLKWFHEFSDKLYLNSSVIASSYTTDNGIDILDTSYAFDGFIKHFGLKEDFTWTPGESNTVKFGVQTDYINLKSAEWDLNNYKEKEQRKAWENTVWINDEWKVNSQLSLSAGLRLNAFSVLGGSPYYILDEDGEIAETLDYKSGKFVKTHWLLEPRLSMNYSIDKRQSIKLGYSKTSQHIHAIRTGSSSMPFDRYAMSSNLLKPETANQVSLGYATLTPKEDYEFSIEGYYKDIRDILDYKDGKSYTSEVEIERIVLAGKGRSYGMELYAKKNAGKLTGWVSYTLSWSENKIPGINNDQWYVAGNDRRHDLSVVGLYQLNDKWALAATWVFNTGQALTAPSAKYGLNGELVYYYAERNGYRAPAYHRLDLSATYTKKRGKYTTEWSFGLYNAYNRYNPYIISFESDTNKPSGTKVMQTSLFGIVPSVSYTLSF